MLTPRLATMASWRLLRYPRRCSYTRCGNIAPFDSFGAFGGLTALIISGGNYCGKSVLTASFVTTVIICEKIPYNRTRASGASRPRPQLSAATATSPNNVSIWTMRPAPR